LLAVRNRQRTAFAHLGSSPLEDAARRALARVADEELIHERR
jgi:hypothetical protein